MPRKKTKIPVTREQWDKRGVWDETTPTHVYMIFPIKEGFRELGLLHGQVSEPREHHRFSSGSEVHMLVDKGSRHVFEVQKNYDRHCTRLHRDDGPALILVEGDQLDYRNSTMKRRKPIRGPLALWFLNGIQIDPATIGCQTLPQAPWFASDQDKMIWYQHADKITPRL